MLSDEEQQLLRLGVLQWFGPASRDDNIARMIGYSSAESQREDVERLHDSISDQLGREEVRRALRMVELAFVNNYYGAGSEWEELTNLTDEATIRKIRELQARYSD